MIYKNPMNDTEYRETLEKAKADLIENQHSLGQLLSKAEEAEKRVGNLREIVAGLSKLLGEDFVEEDALGLTDAIRQAFKTNLGQPLEPTGVRARLQQMGYDISKYGNFMASVHTVINRLVRGKEIKPAMPAVPNKPAYVWAEPTPAGVSVSVVSTVVSAKK
jgi:hypothetical protein